MGRVGQDGGNVEHRLWGRCRQGMCGDLPERGQKSESQESKEGEVLRGSQIPNDVCLWRQVERPGGGLAGCGVPAWPPEPFLGLLKTRTTPRQCPLGCRGTGCGWVERRVGCQDLCLLTEEPVFFTRGSETDLR